MKRRNMTRPVRIMISLGSFIVSGTAFINCEFPHMPDVLIGLAEGTGLGIMIGGLIRLKRGNSACTDNREGV